VTADYLMSYKENHLNRLKPGLFVHPLLYRLILQLSKVLSFGHRVEQQTSTVTEMRHIAPVFTFSD